MPRISAAALSLVHIEPSKRRPDPPAELNEAAAVQWRAIVDAMPADWFPRETHPMLVQLCKHIVRCATIAKVLDKAEADGEDLSERKYQNLIRVEMQLTISIGKLSTLMRLSQSSSSTYDKKRKRTGKKDIPWETNQG